MYRAVRVQGMMVRGFYIASSRLSLLSRLVKLVHPKRLSLAASLCYIRLVMTLH